MDRDDGQPEISDDRAGTKDLSPKSDSDGEISDDGMSVFYCASNISCWS